MKQRFPVDIPGINYVLASSEEERDYIKSIQIDLFNSVQFEEDQKLKEMLLESSKKDLNELDLKMINLAVKGVDFYQKELGFEKKIPTEMIRLLDWDILTSSFEEATGETLKEDFHCGVMSFPDMLFLERPLSDTLFALIIFKGLWESIYSSTAYISNCREGEQLCYFTGLTFPDIKNKMVLFFEVDHSITSYQCQRFYDEFIKNNPIFSEDIAYYTEKAILSQATYCQEGKTLFFNLVKDFSEAGGIDETEVIEELLRAQVNGNLKKIRHFCRLSYGKNGFRELGKKTAILI